jgi:hypothetical protein
VIGFPKYKFKKVNEMKKLKTMSIVRLAIALALTICVTSACIAKMRLTKVLTNSLKDCAGIGGVALGSVQVGNDTMHNCFLTVNKPSSLPPKTDLMSETASDIVGSINMDKEGNLPILARQELARYKNMYVPANSKIMTYTNLKTGKVDSAVLVPIDLNGGHDPGGKAFYPVDQSAFGRK